MIAIRATILSGDQPLVRYVFSKFKKPSTLLSTTAGSGNQNILVNKQNIDAKVMVYDLLNAPSAIGIIKRGLIYQLNVL